MYIACTLYIMSDVSIIGLPSAIIIILINNCELKNLLIGTMLDNCTCGHKIIPDDSNCNQYTVVCELRPA